MTCPATRYFSVEFHRARCHGGASGSLGERVAPSSRDFRLPAGRWCKLARCTQCKPRHPRSYCAPPDHIPSLTLRPVAKKAKWTQCTERYCSCICRRRLRACRRETWVIVDNKWSWREEQESKGEKKEITPSVRDHLRMNADVGPNTKRYHPLPAPPPLKHCIDIRVNILGDIRKRRLQLIAWNSRDSNGSLIFLPALKPWFFAPSW